MRQFFYLKDLYDKYINSISPQNFNTMELIFVFSSYHATKKMTKKLRSYRRRIAKNASKAKKRQQTAVSRKKSFFALPWENADESADEEKPLDQSN